VDPAVETVLSCFPRLFHACHARHRRDPSTGAVLSAHQASILDHLDAIEPTSVGDLAEHLGVTPSTMSISVGRLVRDGYITRARDPSDGRRAQLRLTEAGCRMKQARSVLEPERVASMLARLGEAELRIGLRGLEILADAANKEIDSWRQKRSQQSANDQGDET
jgi:DNA-binding MarR family transcriptional regulator